MDKLKVNIFLARWKKQELLLLSIRLQNCSFYNHLLFDRTDSCLRSNCLLVSLKTTFDRTDFLPIDHVQRLPDVQIQVMAADNAQGTWNCTKDTLLSSVERGILPLTIKFRSEKTNLVEMQE